MVTLSESAHAAEPTRAPKSSWWPLESLDSLLTGAVAGFISAAIYLRSLIEGAPAAEADPLDEVAEEPTLPAPAPQPTLTAPPSDAQTNVWEELHSIYANNDMQIRLSRLFALKNREPIEPKATQHIDQAIETTLRQITGYQAFWNKEEYVLTPHINQDFIRQLVAVYEKAIVQHRRCQLPHALALVSTINTELCRYLVIYQEKLHNKVSRKQTVERLSQLAKQEAFFQQINLLFKALDLTSQAIPEWLPHMMTLHTCVGKSQGRTVAQELHEACEYFNVSMALMQKELGHTPGQKSPPKRPTAVPPSPVVIAVQQKETITTSTDSSSGFGPGSGTSSPSCP